MYSVETYCRLVGSLLQLTVYGKCSKAVQLDDHCDNMRIL